MIRVSPQMKYLVANFMKLAALIPEMICPGHAKTRTPRTPLA